MSRKFSIKDTYKSIKAEYELHNKRIKGQTGINLAKSFLCFSVRCVEWGNDKFDFVGDKLTGWSTHFQSNIDDFDDVLEELYEKYSSNINMAPELKLLFLVVQSAVMYGLMKHLTSSESIGNILQANSGMMNMIANKVMNSNTEAKEEPEPRREVPREPRNDPVGITPPTLDFTSDIFKKVDNPVNTLPPPVATRQIPVDDRNKVLPIINQEKIATFKNTKVSEQFEETSSSGGSDSSGTSIISTSQNGKKTISLSNKRR